MTPVVTFPLAPDQFETLQRLAHLTHRDQAWHLNEALSLYLERQSEQLDSIQEGLDDAQAGHLISLADIENKWGKAPC